MEKVKVLDADSNEESHKPSTTTFTLPQFELFRFTRFLPTLNYS
jgi:hypothetical protein